MLDILSNFIMPGALTIRECLGCKADSFVENDLQKADGLTKSITPQNWPRFLNSSTLNASQA